jgi:uncharacterized SAM-binding protein YcdF (DUF218 family)
MNVRHIKTGFIAGVLVLTLFLFIAAVTPLKTLYDLLSVSEKPQKSGSVFVLCGGAGSRAKYGAYLVERGYADKLVLSGTSDELAFVTRLLGSWMKEHSANVETREITSTTWQARTIADIVGEQSEEKIIVVSSSWHLSRVKLMTERFCGMHCFHRVYFSGVPYNKDSVSKMTFKEATRFLLKERVKYLITWYLMNVKLEFCLLLFD